MKTNETKNEIDKTKKWEEIIKRKDLKHETNKYRLDFQQFKTIRSLVIVFIMEKLIKKKQRRSKTIYLEIL